MTGPVNLDRTDRCPLGVRCECCGAERPDLAVTTTELAGLGVACLTMCSPCSASRVAPPITVSTAARLVAQHAAHLASSADLGGSR